MGEWEQREPRALHLVLAATLLCALTVGLVAGRAPTERAGDATATESRRAEIPRSHPSGLFRDPATGISFRHPPDWIVDACRGCPVGPYAAHLGVRDPATLRRDGVPLALALTQDPIDTVIKKLESHYGFEMLAPLQCVGGDEPCVDVLSRPITLAGHQGTRLDFGFYQSSLHVLIFRLGYRTLVLVVAGDALGEPPPDPSLRLLMQSFRFPGR